MLLLHEKGKVQAMRYPGFHGFTFCKLLILAGLDQDCDYLLGLQSSRKREFPAPDLGDKDRNNQEEATGHWSDSQDSHDQARNSFPPVNGIISLHSHDPEDHGKNTQY